MPIRTFEDSSSLPAIANRIALVDTSYLIALSDTTDRSHSLVSQFHFGALRNGTDFVVNVVVRQEFIRYVRKYALVAAILNLAANNPALEQRYRLAAGIPRSPFTATNIAHVYDRIFKDQVQANDVHLLATEVLATGSNIWSEVQSLETNAGMTYLSSSSEVTWGDLGVLLDTTCMDATDCMIANFAIGLGLDCIVSLDKDFAAVSPVLDIYLPHDIASTCPGYVSLA